MILKLALNCANAKTIKRQWALMIMAENKAKSGNGGGAGHFGKVKF